MLDIVRTYVDAVETAEDIGFGHHQLGDAVEHNGVLQSRQVNPAGPPGAPGGCAKLMSYLPELFAGFIFQFGREGPSAHACTVRLEDANYPPHLSRGNSQPCACACGGC